MEQSYSTSLFIDLKKGAPDYNGTFKIELPPKDQLVPFSEQLEITVVGNYKPPHFHGFLSNSRPGINTAKLNWAHTNKDAVLINA